MRRMNWVAIIIGGLAAASDCSSGDGSKTDAEYRAEVTNGMHDALALEIADWKKAATELAAAAPSTSERGWDPTLDAKAISDMKVAT